ncbi:lysyl oxidase homolog 2A [Trichonephila clavipes]|nr:lysyl oxidase homolog 2A [Trichonephila clavipes]
MGFHEFSTGTPAREPPSFLCSLFSLLSLKVFTVSVLISSACARRLCFAFGCMPHALKFCKVFILILVSIWFYSSHILLEFQGVFYVNKIYFQTFSPKKLEKDIEVRLLGGRYPSEGRVEVKIDGKWGLVCGDGWSLLEATVVCQQAGKGYGQAAVQSSFFGGHLDNITISGLKCTGREQNISECSYESMGNRVSCPGPDDNIAGVICAAELPDLVPDEVEIERSTYLEDRQLVFLQCAMEENCLASAAYKIDKNDYGIWMHLFKTYL